MPEPKALTMERSVDPSEWMALSFGLDPSVTKQHAASISAATMPLACSMKT